MASYKSLEILWGRLSIDAATQRKRKLRIR
jgi:hypothetical protein